MNGRRLSQSKLREFPRLNSNNHRVTSEETDEYNCAAWAFGDEHNWWWPHPDVPEYYWPPGFRRDGTVESIAEYCRFIGYEVCDNADSEVGYHKIVIYGDQGIATHVTFQSVDENDWASKLGDWEDIHHTTAHDLAEKSYGYPEMYLRKHIEPLQDAGRSDAPSSAGECSSST